MPGNWSRAPQFKSITLRPVAQYETKKKKSNLWTNTIRIVSFPMCSLSSNLCTIQEGFVSMYSSWSSKPCPNYFWINYMNSVFSFQCIRCHKINGQIQVDRPIGTLVESMLMLMLIYEVTEDRDADSISFLSSTWNLSFRRLKNCTSRELEYTWPPNQWAKKQQLSQYKNTIFSNLISLYLQTSGATPPLPLVK